MKHNFKDPRVEKFYNNIKKMGIEKDVMKAFNDTLIRMCDQLVDVIQIENGLSAKPSTDVKGWTKDGNLLLTYIEVEEGKKISTDTILCTKGTRDYVSKQLGYEVKTSPYTYSDGHKGIAVVLN